jgi:hypothetical protein
VDQQAADRDPKHINSLRSYLPLRRRTVGTPPAYGLTDLCFNIPDHIVQRPTVQQMSDLTTDMTAMCNYLYSNHNEQARGDADHNLVTMVMHELGLSRTQAYEWIGRYHADILNEFLALYKNLLWCPDESETTNEELRLICTGRGTGCGRMSGGSFEVITFTPRPPYLWELF